MQINDFQNTPVVFTQSIKKIKGEKILTVYISFSVTTVEKDNGNTGERSFSSLQRKIHESKV